jgi:hypothetical protein
VGSQLGDAEHRRGLALGIALLCGVIVGTLGVGDWRLTGDARASEVGGDSADGLILWVDCEQDVVGLTGSELDEWKSRGVDGFVCMGERLRDLGGSQDFTGNPAAGLNSSNYRLQRALRDSNVVERAAARGMKMYLGVKLTNYFNPSTPLLDWFDGPGWQTKVLPKLGDLAAAAKLLGFAGIAFDQEMYPQQDGAQTATWEWDYPGNTHSEAEVREQARRRGAQVMDEILAAFPKAEFAVYHAFFPGDWRELVQEEVNGLTNTSTDRLDIDFWNGMTSVEGYGAIRFFDSVFYKSPHRGTWDTALAYNQNRVYATFSRRFSDWDYAWSRVQVSPFAWVDEGPTAPSFDDARPPAYVGEQLLAFRKWGTGGEFANFVYAPLDSFDYSPYVSAMQNASSPAKVDGEDPTLELTRVSRQGRSASIVGTAHDNLAIRAVRWQDNRGGSGAADLRWEVLSGDYDSGYQWRTRWSIPAGALTPGATRVTIRAVDIKGQASAGAALRAP